MFRASGLCGGGNLIYAVSISFVTREEQSVPRTPAPLTWSSEVGEMHAYAKFRPTSINAVLPSRFIHERQRVPSRSRVVILFTYKLSTLETLVSAMLAGSSNNFTLVDGCCMLSTQTVIHATTRSPVGDPKTRATVHIFIENDIEQFLT